MLLYENFHLKALLRLVITFISNVLLAIKSDSFVAFILVLPSANEYKSIAILLSSKEDCFSSIIRPMPLNLSLNIVIDIGVAAKVIILLGGA